MPIHKNAKTRFPVLDLIRKRWSPRSYSQKEIVEKDVLTLLEAASWSFSASNLQPLTSTLGHPIDFSRNFHQTIPRLIYVLGLGALF